MCNVACEAEGLLEKIKVLQLVFYSSDGSILADPLKSVQSSCGVCVCVCFMCTFSLCVTLWLFQRVAAVLWLFVTVADAHGVLHDFDRAGLAALKKQSERDRSDRL